ncbi:MAG: CRISPR-associated endonuclease Cas2 [Clostridia bacterium]|nr:CRISPR-associated endonuclease Cas2 [Clostridia bacterium]
MYVILAYDISTKKLPKVMKTVKKYLTARQKSVYEGHITQSGLKRLQNELLPLIDPERDSVVIYEYDRFTGLLIHELGLRRRKTDRFY